jgi:hypothetical protein
VGDRAFRLTLPSKGLTTYGGASSGAADVPPDFRRPRLAALLTGGTVSTGGAAMVSPTGMLAVGAVRLRWREREWKATNDGWPAWLSDIPEELGSWFSIVRNWLAAWTGNVRGPLQADMLPRMRMAVVGRPDTGTYSAGGPVPRFVMNQRAASALELRAAFAAASARHDLPLHHQLLAEGRWYWVHGKHREAVISACAATEIALSTSVRADLARSGISQRKIDDILDGVSGVVDLYRLNAARAHQLHVSIGRVMGHLAQPRNKAVHAGELLDQDTARNALRAAVALSAVAPVPSAARLLKETG